MKLEILTLIGKNCVTPSDGEKMYNLVYPELRAGMPVELDFAGVKIFASPFFNFAIGQLLRDISEDNLNRLLDIRHLNPVGRQVLKVVISNSKRYYSSSDFRTRLNQAINEQASNF